MTDHIEPSIKREWIGPFAWLDFGDGGPRVGYQTQVTSCTDIRMTPRGPVNFGFTLIGAQRRVEEKATDNGRART